MILFSSPSLGLADIFVAVADDVADAEIGVFVGPDEILYRVVKAAFVLFVVD